MQAITGGTQGVPALNPRAWPIIVIYGHLDELRAGDAGWAGTDPD